MDQPEGVERLILVKEKEYKYLREIAAKAARDKKSRDKKSSGNKGAEIPPAPSHTGTNTASTTSSENSSRIRLIARDTALES